MRNARALAGVWTAVLASAGTLSAQWTTDRWVSLAEMPVAVTRLEVAGIPLADLRLFVPALNVTQIQPSLFLETVRGVPVMQQYYVMDDNYVDMSGAHPTNHGGYVQYLLSRGLRGTALADAIHQDLQTRGVQMSTTRSGRIDVLHPDYIVIPNGSSAVGRGRAEGQKGATATPGRGAAGGSGRARSLGDDLRSGKGVNEGRPTLEPRGRGNASASPGNAPGRGGGAPAAGRGRGNGGGASGGDGGRGRGNGGGGGGHGRGR
jgi:hypothetical protein